MLQFSSKGVFHTHHNGTCSTFLFTFWRAAKVLFSSLWSDARALVSNTHLEEIPLGDPGPRRNWEGVGKYCINHSTSYHSPAYWSLQVINPVQTPQACCCKVSINLNNCASFYTFKPYPETLQCKLKPLLQPCHLFLSTYHFSLWCHSLAFTPSKPYVSFHV